jgi:hypothetical protein
MEIHQVNLKDQRSAEPFHFDCQVESKRWLFWLAK